MFHPEQARFQVGGKKINGGEKPRTEFMDSMSPCADFFLIGEEGAERSAAGTQSCAQLSTSDAQLQTPRAIVWRAVAQKLNNGEKKIER